MSIFDGFPDGVYTVRIAVVDTASGCHFNGTTSDLMAVSGALSLTQIVYIAIAVLAIIAVVYSILTNRKVSKQLPQKPKSESEV
jgi:preprotein translocase subunit SecG